MLNIYDIRFIYLIPFFLIEFFFMLNGVYLPFIRCLSLIITEPFPYRIGFLLFFCPGTSFNGR